MDIVARPDLPMGVPRRPLQPPVDRLAGVAGPPLRTAGALLYDASRVRALVQPDLDPEDLPEPLRRGMLVGPLTDGPDLTDADRDPTSGVKGEVNLAWLTALLVRAAVQSGARIPCVATLAGFVVAGAEVIDLDVISRDGKPSRAGLRVRLSLAPPGGWYDALHLRRLGIPLGANLTVHPPHAVLIPATGAASPASSR